MGIHVASAVLEHSLVKCGKCALVRYAHNSQTCLYAAVNTDVRAVVMRGICVTACTDILHFTAYMTYIVC